VAAAGLARHFLNYQPTSGKSHLRGAVEPLSSEAGVRRFISLIPIKFSVNLVMKQVKITIMQTNNEPVNLHRMLWLVGPWLTIWWYRGFVFLQEK
jgi:hypothetical protein